MVKVIIPELILINHGAEFAGEFQPSREIRFGGFLVVAFVTDFGHQSACTSHS